VHRRLLLLVAVLLTSLGLRAEVSGTELPPPPKRWVNDDAGLLSPSTRSALDSRLEAYERETGHQVVVWAGKTIGSAPLDEFATRLFEAWKIGRQGKDDGILVIVLKDDRKIAIEVGYGLEDRVPDALASRIIREQMAPRLQAGDPDGALTAGVDTLLSAIEGKPFDSTAPPSAEPAPRKGPGLGQIVFFVIIGVIFLVLLITHPQLALALLFTIGRGGGGFGGAGGGGFGGGGFSGGGGRSGGGGARGSW
jgi:uncharacterized protein